MDIADIDSLYKYIIVFVLALILFHLICVWPKNLSKKNWKYVDYAWLIVGFLSIVSLSTEIRHDRAVVAEELALSRASTMHDLVLSLYKGEPNSFCRTFVKTDIIPANFDEIQNEYQRACGWIKRFGTEFKKATLPGFQRVEWAQFDPPGFSDQILQESIGDIEQRMSYYLESVDELQAVRSAKKVSFAESVFFLIWPYLFAIAVALRIAKTTGEIRHES